MISENIFNREEISKENALQLAKLFQKTLAIYNQIKAARIRGDYSFEQPFYSAVEDLNGLGSDKNERTQKEIAAVTDIKLSE